MNKIKKMGIYLFKYVIQTTKYKKKYIIYKTIGEIWDPLT